MIASPWTPKGYGSNCSSSDSAYDEEGCYVYRRSIVCVMPEEPPEPTEEEKALLWREFFVRWHKKVRALHRVAVYRTEKMVRIFFKKVRFHLRRATAECPSFHWNIYVREAL